MARKSIIQEVMPGWNGRESVVGYIIRKREEKAAMRQRLITAALSLLGASVVIGGALLGATIADALTSHANARTYTYELRVELDGQLYIADHDLSAVDCERAMDEIGSIVVMNGMLVTVPHDAPVYCVSM
jgi:hypothetical protein